MTGAGAPSIDDFLSGARTGRCRICADVPAEQREAIDAKVAQGIHAWKAFGRYLAACGITGISTPQIQYHYQAGHGA